MNTSPLTGIAQATTHLTVVPENPDPHYLEALGAATAAVASFVGALDTIEAGTTRESQRARIEQEIDARHELIEDAEAFLPVLRALTEADLLLSESVDMLEGALLFRAAVDRLTHRRLVALRATFDVLAEHNPRARGRTRYEQGVLDGPPGARLLDDTFSPIAPGFFGDLLRDFSTNEVVEAICDALNEALPEGVTLSCDGFVFYADGMDAGVVYQVVLDAHDFLGIGAVRAMAERNAERHRMENA